MKPDDDIIIRVEVPLTAEQTQLIAEDPEGFKRLVRQLMAKEYEKLLDAIIKDYLNG